MENNKTSDILTMNYRRRTVLLILVWVVLFLAVGIATLVYGYSRSVEIANRTIEASLTKVDESIGELISSEAEIRNSYEMSHSNMGQLIPFLQKHGLEEPVPSKGHMKTYAGLLGADYLAILDPEGKTAASYGEYVEEKDDTVITDESEIMEC